MPAVTRFIQLSGMFRDVLGCTPRCERVILVYHLRVLQERSCVIVESPFTYVLFAGSWLVLYTQALLLKKKTKIAPFTLNPRAPVQVIHRSGAPVLSLLRFRDGFIASQGGSGGWWKRMVPCGSIKHRFKCLVFGARGMVLHERLACCAYHIVFITLHCNCLCPPPVQVP